MALNISPVFKEAGVINHTEKVTNETGSFTHYCDKEVGGIIHRYWFTCYKHRPDPNQIGYGVLIGKK